MGPSSLETEIRALYNFGAPRAGSDGIRDEGESPLVPLNALCAKVARSGRMIVYEQPAKSMVARFGHLWHILRVVSSKLRPLLVLIVYPCRLI